MEKVKAATNVNGAFTCKHCDATFNKAYKRTRHNDKCPNRLI